MNPEVQQGLNTIRNWLASIKVFLSIDAGMISEEKKQLQAVNRSIEQLRKLGVSIPDDLRNLKLKLTARDSGVGSDHKYPSQVEELEELIETLSNLKNEAKQVRHSLRPERKGSGTKTYFGIEVADLMEAGLLSIESHLELQWKKDGDIFEGRLLSDGRIAVRTTSGWKEYDSLSMAASQIAGCSLNGWDKWRIIETNGRRISLMQIRDRYIKER